MDKEVPERGARSHGVGDPWFNGRERGGTRYRPFHFANGTSDTIRGALQLYLSAHLLPSSLLP